MKFVSIESLEQQISTFEELLEELRQRLINTEGKADQIIRCLPGQETFRGSPDQRYGHVSYSQHGEDMVLMSLFERLGIKSPSFLDIGANHPLICSNTALLRERCASTGVNIDASPDVIDIFNKMRPEDTNVNVGVAGCSGTMTFYRIDNTSGRNSFSLPAIESVLSAHPQLKLQDKTQVPVLTLDEVVDRFCSGQFPDLLSLDAEGLDFEILSACTFTSRPKILCVETLSGLGENEVEMDELVKSKGFRKVIQMHANGIFIDQNLDG